jgi:hypothetical protein
MAWSWNQNRNRNLTKVGIETRTVTCQKSEPEKNSYGFATLTRSSLFLLVKVLFYWCSGCGVPYRPAATVVGLEMLFMV